MKGIEPDAYRLVKEIYLAVCNLPRAQQNEEVARLCGGNDRLKQQVGDLLSTLPLQEGPARARHDSEVPLPVPALPADNQVRSFVEAHFGVDRTGRCRVGSLTLVQQIGRGMMGEVWLARDELLARDVAVKFITHTTNTEEGWKVFLDGARAAAAVRHPRLVPLYHADLAKGIPYLVMEYVPCPTLATALEAHGPFSIQLAIAAIEAAADGVSALHAHDIIHRDIKPSNLLLDAEVGVRITDFGLAYEKPAAGSERTIKDAAGTPDYMAPEMFEGVASVRTDVFALAATIFRLLTGKPPPPARSMGEPDATSIIRAIRERGGADAVCMAIARALHPNPVLRTKTAAAFAEVLRRDPSMTSTLQKGRAELAQLALKKDVVVTQADSTSRRDLAPPASSLSLHEIAEAKRASGRVYPDAATLLKPLPPIREPGIVAIDLPCAQCRYSLRGVLSTSRCPECGTSVSASLNPDRLYFRHPRNLQGKIMAIWITMLGLSIHLLSWIAGCLALPPMSYGEPLLLACRLLVQIGCVVILIAAVRWSWNAWNRSISQWWLILALIVGWLVFRFAFPIFELVASLAIAPISNVAVSCVVVGLGLASLRTSFTGIPQPLGEQRTRRAILLLTCVIAVGLLGVLLQLSWCVSVAYTLWAVAIVRLLFLGPYISRVLGEVVSISVPHRKAIIQEGVQ